MRKGNPEVEAFLEARVEELGLEVVELEWTGTSSRPILRLRIDQPQARAGEGITVDDCARVSRALEPWLDEHPEVPERYVLEVSSPGVERPLVRHRDWVRFQGSRVQVKGKGSLAGRGVRVQGELVRVSGGADRFRIHLRFEDGGEAEIGSDEILRARLVFEWDS